MGNGNPIWPGGPVKHDYKDAAAFLEDMLGVKEWHPDIHDWFQKTLDEIKRLQEELRVARGKLTQADFVDGRLYS